MAEYDYRGLEDFRSHIYQMDQYQYNDYSLQPRPCHNIAFMLEGRARFTENEKVIELKENEIIFIPKQTRYCSEWFGNPNIKFHTLHFNFSWQNDPLRNRKFSVQKLAGQDTDLLKEEYQYLHTHQQERGAGAFLFMTRFYQLCYMLFSQFKSEPVQGTGMVQPALAYIERNFRESFTVKELAERCCLSESYFYTCFRNETGISPMAYKNRVCIRNAAYTLISEPEKSIEEISAEYGFTSSIYFRRLFRQITGKTPREYRRAEMLI